MSDVLSDHPPTSESPAHQPSSPPPARPVPRALPQRFETDIEVPDIDLHMHSTASDGGMAPAELVALVARRGVSRMSLTDHDSMEGIFEAQQAASAHGVTLLPGCELSVRWRNQTIHLVALMPEGAGDALSAGLRQQHDARERRSHEIAARMEKLGLSDAMQRAREQATLSGSGDRPLSRPDFARALVEAGLARDLQDAFKRHLGSGQKGDVKAHWPEMEEAVGWIRADGGVAVMAHPMRYKLTRTKRGELLRDFICAGGEAAELVSGFQNIDRARDLARQLDELGLYASVGSDFHFPGGPLAPGSMSPPPRTRVPPVWCHPRLAPFFAAATATM
ncbi:PHP domain-containing protein [Cobetia sp. 14N.309.X.WAT.E.A4]|uniref:PHP domain-containing protein n=1 Tax=Cobetia sp. 14N.309.X.WAT.E.A4 TaxID=2998323 RepID=UPI0025B1F98F|nr:PHP domain-containing protein [Cobetia sp. 14N.309.X.WAT.E.A4]MDN2655661.1 PHP domain-containing protein [Cobetia sp. 14N.309.X.WAT.E.A4]